MRVCVCARVFVWWGITTVKLISKVYIVLTIVFKQELIRISTLVILLISKVLVMKSKV